mmetsp:Transcript_25671/g.37809  ORF Transcript_25671/g.37809 Transcript_25671/m.37809 type:complete len:302 (+) Transcript_25671:268-1173(+)|eukprot:CAMPEP_0195520426 /NCGR_PEP_ID=MMETSP0794_2-20130614/16837_1 /TAXON_ID=515487 /ORGANISM="Stephanopyxis turris, Strain CCMP 815" /LENGTH=301 /DNA_ID=CAMNT_0040649777 /DNA_START=204 /DNA_END=1109 /DNA_ORIENTATION=-
MDSVETMYKVAEAKNSLQEPLLGSDGGSEKPNENGNDEIEKKTLLGTTRQKVVVGVGVACAGINAIHIGVLVGSTFSQAVKAIGYAASGIGVAVPVPVALQESKMAQEKSFRTALNNLRVDVDDFKFQNHMLTVNIEELKEKVDTLHEIEGTLQDITRQQGSDLESFLGLIEEDKRISTEMRNILQKRVLQDVITLVMESDSNGDFHLNDADIDRLVLGIRLIDGVEFNEDRFRQDVEDSNGSVGAVIKMIKHLISDESTGNESIRVHDRKKVSEMVTNSFRANSSSASDFAFSSSASKDS